MNVLALELRSLGKEDRIQALVFRLLPRRRLERVGPIDRFPFLFVGDFEFDRVCLKRGTCTYIQCFPLSCVDIFDSGIDFRLLGIFW